MKRWLLGSVFAVVLSATGCAGGPGSCSQMQAGSMACVEQSGNGVTPEVIQQYCTQAMGTYSAGGCTSANRVGRCTRLFGPITTVMHFYPPLTLAQAEMTCSALSGGATFQAN